MLHFELETALYAIGEIIMNIVVAIFIFFILSGLGVKIGRLRGSAKVYTDIVALIFYIASVCVPIYILAK